MSIQVEAKAARIRAESYRKSAKLLDVEDDARAILYALAVAEDQVAEQFERMEAEIIERTKKIKQSADAGRVADHLAGLALDED